MFSAKQSLLVVAEAYSAATGKTMKTLSRELLGAGSRFEQISGKGDVTTGKCEAAIGAMALNWPVDLNWPDGVLAKEYYISLVNSVATPSVAAVGEGDGAHG